MTTAEINEVSKTEESCQRLLTIPGIGPLISTAMVAAIGKSETYDGGRDFAAWLGLEPRQHSTGGRTILGRITIRDSRYIHVGTKSDCAALRVNISKAPLNVPLSECGERHAIDFQYAGTRNLTLAKQLVL